MRRTFVGPIVVTSLAVTLALAGCANKTQSKLAVTASRPSSSQEQTKPCWRLRSEPEASDRKGANSPTSESPNGAIEQETAKVSGYEKANIKNSLIKQTKLDIQSIKIIADDGSAVIFYKDPSNVNANNAVLHLLRDSTEIMHQLFSQTNITAVTVIRQSSISGSSSKIETSAYITIPRAAANKLNLNAEGTNDPEVLIESASDIYINPAIKSKINDSTIKNALRSRATSTR